jgi:histone H3/H4
MVRHKEKVESTKSSKTKVKVVAGKKSAGSNDGKPAVVKKPYSRYLKRAHAALLRARVNIISARSKEVDTFFCELLNREFNTVIQNAILQAANNKRSQVTAEDMAYALSTSGTRLQPAV